MRRRTFLGSAAATGIAASIEGSATATRVPIGPALDAALIWCADDVEVQRDLGPDAKQVTDTLGGDTSDRHAAFVKSFDLAATPRTAELHLFAFTRYRVYINGAYVGRGPARYQNAWPEYDSWDVAARLVPGRNTIAILAHRDAPNGRIMHHAPGMTALLAYADAAGVERRIPTDTSWSARPDRSFGPREGAWGSIPERIDARQGNDWTAAGYDASGWPHAVRTRGKGFAPLQPRTIPLLRETSLKWKAAKLPARLAAGDTLHLDLDGIALAYHRLTFDATAGSAIEVSYHRPMASRPAATATSRGPARRPMKAATPSRSDA